MSTIPAAEIQLSIDEKSISVPAGTTIFDAARINGIAIPTLCHQQNENLWACAGSALWMWASACMPRRASASAKSKR